MATHARRSIWGALFVLLGACGSPEGREPDRALVLVDADYVSPRFSPDGRALAFAELIPLGSGGSIPRIWVLDLITGERRLLLHADSAMRYAPRSFPQISTLEWEDTAAVSVRLSSGEGYGTEVLFDARTGAIRHEARFEYGADPLGPKELELLDRLRGARPQWSPRLREYVARNAVQLGDDKIIFQNKYESAGQAPVWLTDLAADSIRLLRAIAVGPRTGLVGAVVHNGKAALLVRGQPESELLFFDGEAVRESMTFRSRAPPRLLLRRTTPERATFLLDLGNYDGWNHALLSLGEDGIREVVKAKRLYDADVSPDGALLALNLSDGDRRRIELVKGTW